MTATTTTARLKMFRTMAAPVLLSWACILPACLRVIADPDTGWHLAQGRLIASGQFLHTNRLAWTAVGYPWNPTSWLYDLVAFLTTEHMGLLGLQWLTFAFTAAALVLLALASREVHELGAWVTPAVALLIFSRVTERPQVVSWVVLAAVLWLGFIGERRDWRFRLFATPIIAIGCDFHPGAILGAIACTLFCLSAMRRERAYWRELGIIGAVGLALLANPGSIADTFEHLRLRETIRIQEFELPDWRNAAPFFFAAPAAFLIGAMEWKRRPMLLALAIVFGAIGSLAVRLTADFYVAAAPVLAGALNHFGRSERLRVGFLATLLVATFGFRYRDLTTGPWDAAFDEHRLPVRAARFMHSQHIEGVGYNSFSDGGYLEYALPEMRAYQDGRIHAFPSDFFPKELAAEKSGEAFEKYLTDAGAEFALTGRHQGPLSGRGLIYSPEWALVYWDDVSELYLRHSVERFEHIRKANEYYFFLPRADEIAALKSAGRRALEEIRTEADRFDSAVGYSDVAAAMLRCGAESRLRAESAERSCAAALALRNDEQYRELIKKVRELPPLE